MARSRRWATLRNIGYAEIARLVDHFGVEQVAQTLGVGRTTIENFLRTESRLLLGRGRKCATSKTIEAEAIRLAIDEQKSTREIAAILDIAATTVLNILTRHNVRYGWHIAERDV